MLENIINCYKLIALIGFSYRREYIALQQVAGGGSARKEGVAHCFNPDGELDREAGCAPLLVLVTSVLFIL